MISVDIAAAVLCDFGYSNEQIAVIGDIILATRLPQTPHTLLEQIIADADLDSLGREDFMERGENLRAEMAAFGTEVDDEEWLHEQIYFLEQHIYFTRAARHLRSAGKQRNIRALQAMLAKR
ncbi:MAG: hypothetical protein HC893_02735 [Chloroflexaceae bacterium]|nr:hypothetical protein [Chloroflexaceae bacterium]